MLESVAAGERQHGIDPLRGKSARPIINIDHPLAVDDCVRAHLLHQLETVHSRRRGKYTSATPPRKLNRKGADTARRAVDDNCLALLQGQSAVDTLKSGQACGGDSSGMLQILPLWDRRDFVGRHCDVFGIEAALWVLPAIRIDLVGYFESPTREPSAAITPAPS